MRHGRAAFILAMAVLLLAACTSDEPSPPPAAVSKPQPAATAAPATPAPVTSERFDGEINGIRLGPDVDIRNATTPCVDADVTAIDFAETFDSPLNVVPLYLPPGTESSESLAISCDGVIASVETHLVVPGRGILHIYRFRGERIFRGDYPADRVQPITLAGREGIAVLPFGSGQSAIILAEEWGLTTVRTSGFPSDDLQRILLGLYEAGPSEWMPPDAVGPLMVYTLQIGRERSGDRNWPLLRVVAFDLGAGAQAAAFTVGGVGSFPVELRLAGREVIADLEDRLVAYDLSGLERKLRDAPDGGWFPGFAVSADGAQLALAETVADPPGFPLAPATTVFLDVATGEEVAAVQQSEATYGRPSTSFGRAKPFAWRSDGRGVVVAGDTAKDGPLQVATVFIDGAVRIHDLGGGAMVAPGGNFAAVSTAPHPCLPDSGSMLTIISLDTGQQLAGIGSGGAQDVAFRPVEWSPDGRELLYEARAVPADTSTCEGAEQEPRLGIVRIDGTSAGPVASHLDTRKDWYGDRTVTFICDGAEVPGSYGTYTHRLRTPDACGPGNGAAQILVDGVVIGAGEAIEVLGFIEVPAP